PRPLSEPHRGDRGPRRGAGTPAADVAEVLREVPGPDLPGYRRGATAGWEQLPPAGLQGRAVRDLLPLPGDRGRVLRLRAGARPAPRTLADLRHRPARRGPEKGLPRERGASPGAQSVTAAGLLLAAGVAGTGYTVARTESKAPALLAAEEAGWAPARA